MAITINGTGSITGLTAGGLPDGSITSADLASGAITAGALPSGSILQVVQDSDNAASSLGSVAAGSDSAAVLTVSITPTYSNSRMLIMAHAQAGTTYSIFGMRIKKDGSVLSGMVGASPGTRSQVTAYDVLAGTNGYYQSTFDANYIETLSGASTSTAISYTMHIFNSDSSSQTLYLNRGANDPDTITRGRTFSSLIVMEIAP
jgi:hypothetical protein